MGHRRSSSRRLWCWASPSLSISPCHRLFFCLDRPIRKQWRPGRHSEIHAASHGSWLHLILYWALSENLTERPLLRNFLHPLNREELDVGHRHPLGLQQQIPQVLISAAAVDQHTDVPVHRFYHSEAN